ncbi:MAG: hypothetical protein IT198_12885 [Acidimicrobiia bacterium]|nr:hypothetical protein [Acidimicrobiia bacterium]
MSGDPRGRFTLPRVDGLQRLRLQHWGMIAVTALAIALMWRLRDAGTLSDLSVGLGVAAGIVWAVLTFAAVVALRRRPLRSADAGTLAQSYNIRTVVAAAISMSNLAVAFVLLFASGSFSPVIAPAVSALAGLVYMAPVDAELDRSQRRLDAEAHEADGGVAPPDLRSALRGFRPGELPADDG